MTALATSLDPWALATLDALAEQYARQHGDTPTVTAARRAELLADLNQHQEQHGTSYRPWGRPRTAHTQPATAGQGQR